VVILIKNNYLTLGGLFITLHLLFIFLSRIIVGSEFILVVFLPLLTTIYTLKYGVKEVTMFFIATFLLCGIFEPIATLIYVLPALICGGVYGFLRKKKVKELSLVYITSLSHSISLLISFVFICLLFKEVEFFSIFASFINKEGNAFYASVYLILLLMGILEAFVVHVITNNELKKLGYSEIEEETEPPFWMNVSFFASLLICIVLSIINPMFTCYVFPFILAFLVPNVVEFVLSNNKKWLYLIMGMLLLSGMFLLNYVNAILYPILFVIIFLPILFEKFVRVLYTKLLKSSNNGKNKLE